MLARLVLTLTVSSAVLVPVLELIAAENNHKAPRQRRWRSLFTKFARKKLELSGQLRREDMRPLVGALVYVDASRCSLVLPLTAVKPRPACDDTRVIAPTDRRGRYRVQLRVGRNHKYLHVRFRITEQGKQTATIPLASVDHMLGKMAAGSYYRLDRKPQLDLLQQPRNLIYASRRVALHPSQLQAPWLQENRHLIARTLHKIMRTPEDSAQQEIITVSSCRYSGLPRNKHSTTKQQPLRLVDFRFLLPATGLTTENVAEPDCDTPREPLPRIDL